LYIVAVKGGKYAVCAETNAPWPQSANCKLPKKGLALFCQFGNLANGLFKILVCKGRFHGGRREIYLPLVKIKEDETFENALRRFKRKCEKSGILSELKKRQHFEKPSAKRKRKMLAARKKSLKRLVQERRMMS